MSTDVAVLDKRDEILRIAKANGAARVRVFGSFARGTARPDSDLDLLINLEPGRDLLDLVAIKQDLEELLGRQVHVVTEPGYQPLYPRRNSSPRRPAMSDDGIYLGHILGAIGRIEMYAAVGEERFFSEFHWQDAIIRQLEIIGEATKRLSTDLRRQHPEVRWQRIAGMRDVLVHNYMGVDLDVVWDVTQHSIPEFKRGIEAILADNPQT